MANPNDKQLQQIAEASAQSSATDEPLDGGSGLDIYSWMTAASSLVSPWWSRLRDRQLRSFCDQNDYLSSATATLNSKISTIPFHVEARDMSVVAHVRLADEYTRNLYDMTQFGAGWENGVARWTADLNNQDNGAFFEVIGDGKKDGPIVGPALGLAHLDSAHCNRTNNPIYPVFYHDTDGKRYKLHYTRVIMAAQNPSPRSDMNGVGFCSLSRCIMAAQNLFDIATYTMEKLGSRPKRQIIVARKGLTTNDVITAFRMADAQMDSESLSRFSRNVIIAPKRATANTEIQLDTIDLASTPDGFSEMDSITLGVYLLAWAYGVDAREFWPATATGATKADAMVQHMKARGKAVGNTIGILDKQIDRFFLPPFLKIVHDVQDDDEDQQRAQIRNMNATTRQIDSAIGTLDMRTMRQQMLGDGELTQEQFDELELKDGRLPGGESVLSLFYSNDATVRELLALGVPDPLLVDGWQVVKDEAALRRSQIIAMLGVELNSSTAGKKDAARKAQAALEALEKELTSKAKKNAPPASVAPPVEAPAQGTVPTVPEEPIVTKDMPEDILAEYTRQLQILVARALSGEISADDMAASMRDLISVYGRDLYTSVAAQYGMPLDEDDLAAWIKYQASLAQGFAEAATGAAGDADMAGMIFARRDMWSNSMADLANTTAMLAQPQKMVTWKIDAHHVTKEHCGTCYMLNGKRHPLKWFLDRGYIPRQPGSPTLECGGWHCGCGFKDDDGNLVDSYGA